MKRSEFKRNRSGNLASFLKTVDLKQDLLEQLQKAASSVSNMSLAGRQWVAKMSDVVGGRHAKTTPPLMSELQRLVTESHALPVKVREAAALRDINAVVSHKWGGWQWAVPILFLSSFKCFLRWLQQIDCPTFLASLS